MAKILYTEDNADTAEAVRIMLTGAGHDVDIAKDGKECLAKSSQEKYDLYLLDIMLPDMSGWDILEKIKGKLNEGSKFAFLSAIPVSAERMDELKKAGVSDYITKPFTKDDLIQRVEKALS